MEQLLPLSLKLSVQLVTQQQLQNVDCDRKKPPRLPPLASNTHMECLSCLRSLTSLSYQPDVIKLQMVKVICIQFTYSAKADIYIFEFRMVH